MATADDGFYDDSELRLSDSAGESETDVGVSDEW